MLDCGFHSAIISASLMLTNYRFIIEFKNSVSIAIFFRVGRHLPRILIESSQSSNEHRRKECKTKFQC